MNKNTQATRNSESRQPQPETLPDQTPRNIDGDDSLAQSSPTDSRSDEKVLVNTNRGNTPDNRRNVNQP